jgi:acetyl coenzyme A synthetase (ADP forming)-like protein
MSQTLDAIFRPRSIAVVGASTKEGNVGYVILNNLQRFNYKGQIYPVNPRAEFVGSLKCYSSVLNIPDKVDLAIIVVPRDFVKQAVEDCGEKGISGVIIITSGFKEIGGEGIQKERELLEIVRKYGMRMVGPNCYGALNADPEYSVNATFSKLNPLRGKVAFLSQSGALGEVVIDYTNRLNLGLSMFISIGNKADISDIDVLQYWRDDPETQVILMYMENIENPQEFIKITREIVAHKPILAVKAGRTVSGARAISSHTGVLAGGDVGTNAFFDKCGIIRATSIEEVFDIAIALSNQPLLKGDRVAVITNAGGPGILATDAIESLGLKMARFEQETIAFLRDHLSPMAAVENPIDVIAAGGSDAYGAAVEASLRDKNVDAVIVIFVPPILVDHRAVINAIIEKVEKFQNGKTVLSCLMGSPSGIAGSEDLIQHNIPIYAFPEGAARAIQGMNAYRKRLEQPEGKIIQFDVDKMKAQIIIDAGINSKQKFLMGLEALEILSAYGIRTPGTIRITSESELKEALQELHMPLAMKIDDPAVVHKTDSGGVILKLNSIAEVKSAFDNMKRNFSSSDHKFAGVILQEMVTGGIETIIGMNYDPSLGPLMMFGLGGINVEIMKDVAFKVFPLTDSEAEEMIKSIKGYKLLSGYRGSTAVDISAIEETLLRLSQLAGDFPILESFDVNPFIVVTDRQKSMAVDARFVIKIEKMNK